MSDKIEHQGVIESISGDCVRVSIIQVAACSECKAKSLCTSSESRQKYIDVYAKDASRYNVGDIVNVCGSLQMGRKAVRIAFMWPMLIILLTGLVSLGLLRWTEPAAIGLILLCLSAYFVVTYFNRDRLADKFAFWIESVST